MAGKVGSNVVEVVGAGAPVEGGGGALDEPDEVVGGDVVGGDVVGLAAVVDGDDAEGVVVVVAACAGAPIRAVTKATAAPTMAGR